MSAEPATASGGGLGVLRRLPGGRAPLLVGGALVTDAAIALVVLAVSLQPLLATGPAVPWWGFALVTGQSLLLVARRRHPVLVGSAVGLLAVVQGVSALPEPAVPFAGLVGLYTAAAHSSRRLSLAAAWIAGAGVSVALLLDTAEVDLEDYVVNYLIFATAWLLGEGARNRRERATALEQQIAQAEQLRAADAQRVLAEERTRIARELHDVVAHAVSMMVVQAEAGPVVVGRDPARAVAAFDQISATGKQALTEMRRLLGVLRSDPADRLVPQPGLDELPALIAGLQTAGMQVELEVQGEARALPPSVTLSAYRIVQEALTNALRHAGPTKAVVTVRYGAQSLRVTVVDQGRLPGHGPGGSGSGRGGPVGGGPAGRGAGDGGSAGSGAGGGGNGLVGMRERAALLHGTLEAGPAPDGRGWTVHAELPVPEHAPPAGEGARPAPGTARPAPGTGPPPPGPAPVDARSHR